MSSQPQVSLTIPTLNRLVLVREAVASALGQEDVNLEILVVDDASTDGTAEALRGLGSERLQVLVHEARRGVSQARNLAVEAARGEWLAFLDDDDLWAPSRVRVGLEAARRTRAGLTYAGRMILDEHRRAVAAVLPERPEDVPSLLRWGNVLGGPSAVMARMEAVRRAGGFDVRLSALGRLEAVAPTGAERAARGLPRAARRLHRAPGEHAPPRPWSVADEFQRLAAEPWGLEQRSFGHWPPSFSPPATAEVRRRPTSGAPGARVVGWTTPWPSRRCCLRSENRSALRGAPSSRRPG